MFKFYDQNHDGLIDYNELQTALRAILIMTDVNFDKDEPKIDKIAQTLFRNMDKDMDKKINREDFIRIIKQNDILNSLLCPRNINNIFPTTSH